MDTSDYQHTRAGCFDCGTPHGKGEGGEGGWCEGREGEGGEEEGGEGGWCEGEGEKGEVEGGEGRRGRGGWCERREREGREREEGEGGRGREGRESGVRGNGKGQTDTSSKHAELLLSMRQWSSTRQVYSPSVTLPDTLSFSPVVPIGLHWRGREHTVHTWAHTDAHACTHRQTHSDTQHSPRPHAAHRAVLRPPPVSSSHILTDRRGELSGT